MPLLKRAVNAGAVRAAVTDEDDNVLWSTDDGPVTGAGGIAMPLALEGEIAGKLVLVADGRDEALVKSVAELSHAALRIIIASKLKRILTTEIHTRVVSQSYEELLDVNRKLAASENSLRLLAESLELKVEERTAELKKAHARLLQQEKMASVGQLAAGVAHEINNPLGFISSNLQTMDRYAARLIAMLDFCCSETAGEPRLAGAVRRKWEELKLEFIRDDIFALLKQSREGVERVRKIVSDLKDFSHVETTGQCPADLNEEIDKTLNVLAHELPEDAEIVRNYRPLPGFVCNPALLCQVFLNIVLNAVQACPKGLRLVIDSGHDKGHIRLSFADNGPGIPEQIRSRIFEPFFTTRDVGSGTGMGLTVAYDIISGYGGTIEVSCPEEGGAVFMITLPMEGAD